MAKELKDMKAKFAAKEQEIEELKKGLREKIDQNHALELQVETLPILRSKIKELERIIEFNHAQKAKNYATPPEQNPNVTTRDLRSTVMQKLIYCGF